MQKLYVNENFPFPAVICLRELGYDVLTSLDAGNANQAIPDEDVLKFATQHERILLTLNRKDFIKIHNNNPNHSGIVICKVNSNFRSFATQIHQVLSEQNGVFQNQLIRVNKV